MSSKSILLSIVGLALCGLVAAIPKPVTPNPALRGVSIIEPAPDYNCTSNGAHPHETDCQYFYDCWNGEAHLGVCTELQLFDLRWRGCEEARNVDCGDRFRPTNYPSTVTPPATTPTVDPSAPTTQATTPPPVDFTCPEPGGAFPHELRCDYYFLCQEGMHTLLRCPLNYLFDLVYAGCNFPEQTQCQDRERPPGYPGGPNTTTTTTRATTTTTTTTVRTTTPGGTGTPAPTQPTEEPVTVIPTTQPPENFTCPQPGGAFPHSEKCEYYWVCIEGEATLNKCELDFLFDLVWSGCNYPELTDCQDRERPPGYSSPTTRITTSTTTPRPITDEDGSTIPTTTTTGRPGFECPIEDGNYPDPYDCKSFYQCVFGMPFHQTCPDGLYYSTVSKVCDYPAAVDCGDRPTKKLSFNFN